MTEGKEGWINCKGNGDQRLTTGSRDMVLGRPSRGMVSQPVDRDSLSPAWATLLFDAAMRGDV